MLNTSSHLVSIYLELHGNVFYVYCLHHLPRDRMSGSSFLPFLNIGVTFAFFQSSIHSSFSSHLDLSKMINNGLTKASAISLSTFGYKATVQKNIRKT